MEVDLYIINIYILYIIYIYNIIMYSTTLKLFWRFLSRSERVGASYITSILDNDRFYSVNDCFTAFYFELRAHIRSNLTQLACNVLNNRYKET